MRRLAHSLLCLVLAGPLQIGAVAAASPASPAGVVGGPAMASRGIVLPPQSHPLPPNLTAHGWVLADLDSGDVLAARDAHGRYAPASTLKTLTALTLLPRLTNRRAVVVCTDADVRVDGSKVGLVPHGRYTVDLLFQAMLMMSGNDAANALARAAGGVPTTVALMNAEARRLDAYDTHAVTPSGLDGPGQATSAYDLALIARAALQRADFRRYVAQRNGTVPRVSAKYAAFQIANQNALLYYYPGAFGVKTGYTDADRHTFVGAAARHGRRLVVTFLRGERRPIDMWRQAAALLDWGFALPRATPAVGHLVEPGEATGGTVGASTVGTATPTPPPPPGGGTAAGTASAVRGHRWPALPAVIAAVAGVVAVAAAVVGALLARRRA